MLRRLQGKNNKNINNNVSFVLLEFSKIYWKEWWRWKDLPSVGVGSFYKQKQVNLKSGAMKSTLVFEQEADAQSHEPFYAEFPGILAGDLIVSRAARTRIAVKQ